MASVRWRGRGEKEKLETRRQKVEIGEERFHPAKCAGWGGGPTSVRDDGREEWKRDFITHKVRV